MEPNIPKEIEAQIPKVKQERVISKLPDGKYTILEKQEVVVEKQVLVDALQTLNKQIEQKLKEIEMLKEEIKKVESALGEPLKG